MAATRRLRQNACRGITVVQWRRVRMGKKIVQLKQGHALALRDCKRLKFTHFVQTRRMIPICWDALRFLTRLQPRKQREVRPCASSHTQTGPDLTMILRPRTPLNHLLKCVRRASRTPLRQSGSGSWCSGWRSWFPQQGASHKLRLCGTSPFLWIWGPWGASGASWRSSWCSHSVVKKEQEKTYAGSEKLLHQMIEEGPLGLGKKTTPTNCAAAWVAITLMLPNNGANL